jgi:hypothetical protein
MAFAYGKESKENTGADKQAVPPSGESMTTLAGTSENAAAGNQPGVGGGASAVGGITTPNPVV